MYDFRGITPLTLSFTAFLCVMFLPFLLFAQEVAPVVPDVGAFADALGARHWPLVAALGLTIVVWVFRVVLKGKFPAMVVPWVTLSVTVVGAIATGMIQAINAEFPWWQGLINGAVQGLSIGLPALGIWSAGVKKILPLAKVED